MTAMHACRWAHIDHMVGGKDGFFVMLHHDDGIAQIAQALKAFQKALIVALVQADGGLVQHIKNPGETGANLAGQPDTLTFTAGKRSRRTA